MGWVLPDFTSKVCALDPLVELTSKVLPSGLQSRVSVAVHRSGNSAVVAARGNDDVDLGSGVRRGLSDLQVCHVGIIR
ncbi:MAG: hypothetical protein LC118_12085 [Dehalococcoidia bacterium]|nr:hypothetical protein [Dehalococcoidia bacterium]